MADTLVFADSFERDAGYLSDTAPDIGDSSPSFGWEASGAEPMLTGEGTVAPLSTINCGADVILASPLDATYGVYALVKVIRPSDMTSGALYTVRILGSVFSTNLLGTIKVSFRPPEGKIRIGGAEDGGGAYTDYNADFNIGTGLPNMFRIEATYVEGLGGNVAVYYHTDDSTDLIGSRIIANSFFPGHPAVSDNWQFQLNCTGTDPEDFTPTWAEFDYVEVGAMGPSAPPVSPPFWTRFVASHEVTDIP